MGERESTFLRLWLILFCFCLDRSCVHWRQNIECCVPKADDSTWCDIKSLAKLYSFDYELKVRLLPVWLWGSLLLFLLLQIASSRLKEDFDLVWFFQFCIPSGASCLPFLSLMVLEQTLQILEIFKAGEWIFINLQLKVSL